MLFRSQPYVLTTLSGFPTFVGGYNDLSTDTLYLIDSTGAIYTWETAAVLSFTWNSKPLRVYPPVCPACGRIYASGAVNLQLWADGISVFSGSIADSSVFRLPGGYRAKQFQIQLTGSNSIDSITIANAVSELQ